MLAPAPCVATPAVRSLRDALSREVNDVPIPDGVARVIVFDSAPWKHVVDQAIGDLTGAERGRALRFRQQHHRDTYVLAHAAWRHALAAALGMAPCMVPLTSDPHGRPYLPGTGLATSLSHSGGHVAIAIARASCIGVDIEQSPTRADLCSLIDMLCTADEAHALQRLAPASREPALLALWTRKEALLKAYGVGLRQAPSGIQVDPDVPIAPPASTPGAPWCRVHALSLPASLMGAVAAPVGVRRIALHGLSP